MGTTIKHRVLPDEAKTVKADLARLQQAVAGDRRIEPGDQGLAVAALQRMLRGLDLFNGKVTGKYGGATRDAVRKLEAQLGVKPDGRIDAFAIRAMQKRQLFVKPGLETPVRVGQKGSDVAELEAKLHNLGYHTGKVDGVFDAKTAAAVKAYRRDDPKVPDDGGAGPRVMAGLRNQLRTLEANLKALGGKPGKVDCWYSKDTARAVRAFQSKHHLKATGIANAATRKAIQNAVVPPFEKLPVPNGRAAIEALFGKAGPNGEHQVTTQLPLGPHGSMTSVTLNEKLVPTMRAMLAEAKQKGLLEYIQTFNGMYNYRNKRSPSGTQYSDLSTHSWGIAFDINASVGGVGGSVNPRLAALFQRYGFVWGKAWGDPMHFQYATGY